MNEIRYPNKGGTKIMNPKDIEKPKKSEGGKK